MLTLGNLKKLSELTENDMILVYTADGVKAISSQLFGAAVSPTTLYERFAKSISSIFNAEKISTSNKVQRYLLGDTSNEVYMEINKTDIVWYESEVSMTDDLPQTEQYVDMSGKPVYWSEDPDSGERSEDGYPWKAASGKKIHMTYEETLYPVICYKYVVKTLKKSILGENGLTDEYFFGSRQSGIIKKTDTEFIFSMSIGGQECGIKVVVDKTTGDISGELLGLWDGINDIDPSQRLTKDSIKRFMYEDQDLNSYNTPIMLDTSNRIGWYLMEDTSNKVFSYIKDGEIIVRRARVKRNISTGNPISSQAKNIYGNLLYWTENMNNGGSISAYGYPLKNGAHVFLTTEETDNPAYVYEYDYDDLLKMSYDSQNGIEQEFKDASGNIGKLFLSQSGFNATFVDNTGEKETSIIMNGTSGTLSGDWKVRKDDKTTFDIVPKELPEIPEGIKNPMLSIQNGNIVWVETPKELESYVSSTPDSELNVTVQLENNKTYVIQQESGEINLNVQIPDVENNTVIRSRVFVPSTDISITWGSNIIGTDSSKVVNESGNTEFILTHYKGLNDSIYLTKL